MDVLPKVLKPQLLLLLKMLVGSLVAFFWQSGATHILKLSHAATAQTVLLLGAGLLFLLISWTYLFLKNRLYRKQLLQYDPEFTSRQEYDKWFNHYADKKSA